MLEKRYKMANYRFRDMFEYQSQSNIDRPLTAAEAEPFFVGYIPTGFKQHIPEEEQEYDLVWRRNV